MGPAIGRLGDIGIGTCLGHLVPIPITVTITLAATTVISGGKGVANLGCVGIASCGHATIATLASATVLAEVKGVHRIGDVGLPTPGGTYT
jgi:uncharacterized membrane protein YadS